MQGTIELEQAQDRNLTIFRPLDENDGKRPDLLLQREGVNGRDLYLDVTISHPTCPSYVNHACTERGTICIRNNAKYKEIVLCHLHLNLLGWRLKKL